MSESHDSSSAVLVEGSGGVDQFDDGFKDSTSVDLENLVSSFVPTSSTGNNTVLDSDPPGFQEGIVHDFDSSPDQVAVIPVTFSNEEDSNGTVFGFDGFGISENGGSGTDSRSVNQELISLESNHEQLDASQHRSSYVDDMKDLSLGEDAGKEEAFVDAPDHLLVVDGRSSSAGELEKLDIRDFVSELEVQLHVEDEKNVQELMDELTRLRHELDKTVAEKELIAHEFEEYKSHSNGGTSSDLSIDNEEREMLGRELANFHRHLQMLTNHQSLLEENSDGLVDRLRQAEKEDGDKRAPISHMPLPLLFDDCTKLATKLQNALDERVQFEGTIRELHAVLFIKDQEIEELNAKVAELFRKGGEPAKLAPSCVELETNCEQLRSEVIRESVAQDVVFSYVGSMHKAWSEQEGTLKELSDVQSKGDVVIDAVSKRIVASLAAVAQHDEVLGSSCLDRMAFVEKNIIRLIENYTSFLFEIDHLGKCLAEVNIDFKIPEEKEVAVVFEVARKGLLESSRKQLELREQLDQSHSFTAKLEEENTKLMEELNRAKESLEGVDSERNKIRMDLEQAENKWLGTKEKLEEEKTKLMEELNCAKESLEVVDSERNKIRMDLEQAENKWLGTKEKLSMAVTKGKALVQQRDSLRQSLAEKNDELEKCLLELQKKSNDLEAAEAVSLKRFGELEEKLLGNQNSIISLQESHLQKSVVLQKIEEIISEKDAPEETKSMQTIEKVGWLVNQSSSLEEELLKSQTLINSLKESLLQKSTFVQKIEETMSQVGTSGELQLMEVFDKVRWLANRRNSLEDELTKSQNLIVSLEESLLQKSTALEKIEKIMSQTGNTEELTSMDIIDKVGWLANQRNSLEGFLFENKKLIISLQELLLNKTTVLQKIEEILSPLGTLEGTEIVDKIGWLTNERNNLEVLVSGNQNLFNRLEASISLIGLPETISAMELESRINWLGKSYSEAKSDIHRLEDEINHARLAFPSHESELSKAHEEVNSLRTSLLAEKLEKDSLQTSVEELACKYEDMVEQLSQVSSEKDELIKKLLEVAGETMDDQPSSDANVILEKSIQNIKEKIISSSLLGKEEVQRLQSSLEERNQELEQCKKMLEEASSTETLQKSKITSLSDEVKRLTEELVVQKDESDTLQKELEQADVKSSRLLELSVEVKRLTEELVVLKDEKDTLQKELEQADVKSSKLLEESVILNDEKDSLQKDLERADEKVSLLREKLSMAVKKGKGLVQERENFKLSIDERNVEIDKLKSELQLRESEILKFKDQIKSLSDELERAAKLESEVIPIRDQKDQVERYLQESNAMLQKVMDSMESIVSPNELVFDDPVEKLNWVKEYFHESQTGKSLAKQELEKAKEEVGMQARELAGAHATIKSLEDALSQVEGNLAIIVDEKKETESKTGHELGVLKAELAACMEELAGNRCKLENQNAEIVIHLNQLQMLKYDGDQILPLLARSFSAKFEGMRSMGLLLQDTQNQIAQLKNSEWLHERSLPLQISPGRELDEKNDPYKDHLVTSPKIEEHLNGIPVIDVTSTKDTVDNVAFHLTAILGGYNTLLKLISDKFEEFSTSMDQQISVLLQMLQTTKDEVVYVSEIMKILKLNVNSLEANNQTQEIKISALQKIITILHSACTDATKELQSVETHQNLLESNSMVEWETTGFSLTSGSREIDGDTVEYQWEKLGASKYVEAAENLLQISRIVQTQAEQFERIETKRLETIDDLQNQLKEIKFTAENAIQVRDLSQNRVSKLEEALEELQRYCNNMKLKLEDLQAKDVILMEKEAEISSLYHALAVKGQDVNIFSEAQMGSFFEKVKEIEAAYKDLGIEAMESHLSSSVEKLFYIIDNVIELQQRLKKTIYEKEELKAILAAQDHEISNLRNESGRFINNNQDLEKKNSDLADLKLGLERFIQKMGGYDLLEDKNSVSAKGLLAVLEKVVAIIILESESSKAKAQEMDAKLHSSQKVMDELSAKVRLLEDSLRDKPAPPDTVMERGIFEASSLASGSEISEIEDMGQLGKNPIPTSAAPHVRTMRKGSSDHLALSIDLESDRLISHHESDDKGHVFKSLNTSGLVPKQAKLVADRVDGIWVSGGRILMRRPGARMSLIAYWLVLHIWLMASIL